MCSLTLYFLYTQKQEFHFYGHFLIFLQLLVPCSLNYSSLLFGGIILTYSFWLISGSQMIFIPLFRSVLDLLPKVPCGLVLCLRSHWKARAPLKRTPKGMHSLQLLSFSRTKAFIPEFSIRVITSLNPSANLIHMFNSKQ